MKFSFFYTPVIPFQGLEGNSCLHVYEFLFFGVFFAAAWICDANCEIIHIFQVTLSYKLNENNVNNNLLNLPGSVLIQKEDPTRILSIHCFLHPTAKICRWSWYRVKHSDYIVIWWSENDHVIMITNNENDEVERVVE